MIIQVKVKPNAKTNSLKKLEDGTWLAQVKAAPVDGKANDSLTAIIAEHFSVPKSSVRIRTGARSKLKRVEVFL